jgi:ribosomal protein S18 acetylase RimI-like enzyme
MGLQRAGEADFAVVVELANAAYRGVGAQPGWSSEAGMIEGLRLTLKQLQRDLAAKPEAHLLVWREDAGSDLLGTVWLEPKDAETWYLGLLTVRPDMQDRKLGRELLAAAERYVLARGGRRVRMTVVNVREALIAWYRRRGYEITGETEAFPYGDERFGRPLRTDLCFVVLEKVLAAGSE